MPPIDILLLAEIVYFVLLFAFITLLMSRTRHYLRRRNWYQNGLNVLILARQILVFLSPFCVTTTIFGLTSALDQLPALIALGLSIIIFWLVQLPLLMKADIFVDFSVGDIRTIEDKDYRKKIVLNADKDNIVNTRIQNMGFSTLKNASILISFSPRTLGDFKPIGDPERYRDLDFSKKFQIQERHSVFAFTPNKNFQTIPPQEILIFQTIVHAPKNLTKSTIIIEFSSENSWGKKQIEVPIRTVDK